MDEAHLASYLNEFVFRFNRRPSHSRGLLFYRASELAVAQEPVRYRDLIMNRQPKTSPPIAPAGRGHPPAWSVHQPTPLGNGLTTTAPVAWLLPSPEIA